MLLSDRSRFNLRFVVPVLALFLLTALFGQTTTVQAATFNPGCTAGVGDGAALVSAVASSNFNFSSDTINLVAGCTYTITEQLDIFADFELPVIVNGNGATIIWTNGNVFEIEGGGGAAIFNDLTIANGNTAITNYGIATLNNTTLRDNNSGIHNQGDLTVNNSTITGSANQAITQGLYLTMNNSTIAGNRLGITIFDETTINNSIIADNTQSNCSQIDGDIHAKHSLFETSGCDFVTDEDNLSGVDPDFGALTGSPAYFPLNTDSPAIDAGDNALIPGGITEDQAGGPRIQGGTVDMGSFEYKYASLTIQLNLQARPTPPNPGWVTTTHVQIRPAGGGPPSVSDQLISDNEGRLTITDLVPGNYNIWVKGTHTLARVHPITLIAGTNTLNTSLLLEGDASDDNQVILVDFSLLASSFGTQTGQPAFDARADFNADGAINLIDFSLLASNFGQAGAP